MSTTVHSLATTLLRHWSLMMRCEGKRWKTYYYRFHGPGLCRISCAVVVAVQCDIFSRLPVTFYRTLDLYLHQSVVNIKGIVGCPRQNSWRVHVKI